MNPLELEAAIADRDLWKARAELAEIASARKEHLLALMSKAATDEGRIIVAVGVDVGPGTRAGAMYIQSGRPDEEETLRRLMESVRPWLELLTLAVRHADGTQAGRSYRRVARKSGVKG